MLYTVYSYIKTNSLQKKSKINCIFHCEKQVFCSYFVIALKLKSAMEPVKALCFSWGLSIGIFLELYTFDYKN